MSESVGPFLGSIADSLSKNGRYTYSGASPQSVDRALGAAASLGLSLTILRLFSLAYTTVKGAGDAGDDVGKRNEATGLFYNYIRLWLRRFLLDEGEDLKALENNGGVAISGGAVITHQGSCHCESVAFEILAPRCLYAQDGPGKIQYKHTEVLASNFRVLNGKECLRTYYVDSKRSMSRGAHVFCERCGVHVLYAPCKNSATVFINVNCVSEGIRKVHTVGTLDTIADGVCAERQWDEVDQLSTISEVTEDSRFVNRLYRAESFLSSGVSNLKLLGLDEGFESSDSFSDKEPVSTPATAATYDSFSGTDSQVSGSILSPVEIGSTDATETKSIGSAVQLSVSTQSRSKSRHSASNYGTNLTTDAPQVRNKMKFFMEKHLSGSAPIDEGKKETQ